MSNLRESNIEEEYVSREDREKFSLAQERFEEIGESIKFDRFCEKLFFVTFRLMFILDIFFRVIWPYAIEKIPATKGEIIFSIFLSVILSVITSGFVAIPVMKIYEYRKRLPLFFVIFTIILAMFIKAGLLEGIAKFKLITYEDYVEAMENIIVNNEAELAEKVEEYIKKSDNDSKEYSAIFFANNYNVKVVYNEDFSIKKSDFNFTSGVLPSLITCVIMIQLCLPTLIFWALCTVLDLIFVKNKK